MGTIITILIFAFVVVLGYVMYANTRNTAKEYSDEEVSYYNEESSNHTSSTQGDEKEKVEPRDQDGVEPHHHNEEDPNEREN